MPRPRRYDREYRYSHEYLNRATPNPWGGLYPPMHWGGGPIYGLEGGGPIPFGTPGISPYAYDYVFIGRRRPEESPTFGAGGDRAVRRWAREHGYEPGPAIRPGTRRRSETPRRRRSRPSGYDAGYRGREYGPERGRYRPPPGGGR